MAEYSPPPHELPYISGDFLPMPKPPQEPGSREEALGYCHALYLAVQQHAVFDRKRTYWNVSDDGQQLARGLSGKAKLKVEIRNSMDTDSVMIKVTGFKAGPDGHAPIFEQYAIAPDSASLHIYWEQDELNNNKNSIDLLKYVELIRLDKLLRETRLTPVSTWMDSLES